MNKKTSPLLKPWRGLIIDVTAYTMGKVLAAVEKYHRERMTLKQFSQKGGKVRTRRKIIAARKNAALARKTLSKLRNQKKYHEIKKEFGWDKGGKLFVRSPKAGPKQKP